MSEELKNARTETPWEELMKGSNNASEETAETKYAMPTDPDEIKAIQDSARKYMAERREKAPELARREAEYLRDTDKQFLNLRKQKISKGEDVKKEDFLLWEKDYAESWELLQKELRTGGIYTTEREAEIEYPMFFTRDEKELHETIEAQAGNYYKERNTALREAIKARGDRDAQKDIDAISEFTDSVFEHLGLKYLTGSEIRERYGDDYRSYNIRRTAVHNKTILALNHLNALAKKYGTTPFTPRDFWTSNKDMKRQTPEESARMRYDRDVVEEYYAIAFSKEAKEYEESFKRRQDSARYYYPDY